MAVPVRVSGSYGSWRAALVVALMLALAFGVRAHSALGALQPARTGPVSDVEVVLLDDPRPARFGRTARAELDGDVVLLTSPPFDVAFSSAAAGDRLSISGSVRGSAPQSSWAISRKVVGTVTVTESHIVDRASGLRGAANSFRSILRRGARHLDRDAQALLAGLTVGDDRDQSALTTDAFRAAGLGHLLAVSGQNVVFVLLLVSPGLKRIKSQALRLAATILLLAFFGFVTRFEPSVTRAITMVGLGILADSMGRRSGAIRTLPAAVALLLIFDPLLAWSLAFQLSVAATIGLLVLSPRLADRVPGPRPIAEAVAATTGAQIAVAPLLLWVFEDVSLVALPANLVATPVAGAAMMWGVGAGLVAGVLGEPAAIVLHAPTSVMLWWINGVASTAARLEVGTLNRSAALISATGLLSVHVGRTAWADPRLASIVVRLGVVVAAAALLFPVLVPRPLPPGQHALVAGVTVLRSEQATDVLVLTGSPDIEDTLGAIRRARLGRIDLVIAVEPSRETGRLVHALTERYEITDVWAPPGHSVPGARTLDLFVGTIGSELVEVVDGRMWLGSDDHAARR